MDRRKRASGIQLDPPDPSVPGFQNGHMGRPTQEAKMAKTKEAAPASKNQPSHGVFAVENEGPNAYWTRIGSAWPHQDGQGLNVSLTAIPISGRLVVRARTEQEAGE